ncbi:MAG: glucose-6-phosphate dehydrogenase [Nanoarchaeota archaeon]
MVTATPKTVPVTFVIMGVTGDLSKKKLLPALHRLLSDKKIDDILIVGIGTRETDEGNIIRASRESVNDKYDAAWRKIEENLFYFPLDFYDEERFAELATFIDQKEKEKGMPGNRLFYLTTLPQHFDVITRSLSKFGIAPHSDKRWSRVAFEKPFGHDLPSARHLNNVVHSVFPEEQVFRVDHYLAKELVQNIAILRFSNRIFEPIWSRHHIEHIQIIISEDYGTEGRGKFYDRYGAIRDVIQNHVLQLLALVTMEEPAALTPEHIHDRKLEILQSLKCKGGSHLVRGQYSGYRTEEGVDNKSTTETMAALKLYVDTERWNNLPIYVLTGKKMSRKMTAIHIYFRSARCTLQKVCAYDQNVLTLQITPQRGVYLRLNGKAPGKREIAPIKLDFCHECTFGPNTPEAYENVFSDIIENNTSGFIRGDEIEAAWKFVDRLLALDVPVVEYRPGELPEASIQLLRHEGNAWDLSPRFPDA